MRKDLKSAFWSEGRGWSDFLVVSARFFVAGSSE